jgi:tRNA modification GTPase
VFDGSEQLTPEDFDIFSSVVEVPSLIILNKNDLPSFGIAKLKEFNRASKCVSVSAETGEGIQQLQIAIVEPFIDKGVQENSFLITNARHFDLLNRSVESLLFTEKLLKDRSSEDLILVGLYDALRFLDEITGETTPEDVLSQIFSTFCIGK